MIAALTLAAVLLDAATGAPPSAEGPPDREALARAAFPDADRVEPRQVVLDDETARRIEELAHARVRDRKVTFYTARRGAAVAGYLVVHTHVVRTKPETLAIAFEPDGRIRRITVLSFLEPAEYRPSDPWLDVLRGKGVDAPLTVGRDVPPISGASLTARGVTENARWLLQVLRLAAGEVAP
ncbi:MAG TPA: FMN-binding protein [Anaeromyxobacteraceae bacterium]|nr:FMN-binding protein [Anaeromyxobacteraceae bacterium]